MLLRISTVLVAAALAFTTACAPKAPGPIYAQPTFNKYGEAECVPDRPPVQQPGTAAVPTYPPDLPPCCPEGYTVSQDGEICLPPPPDREPNDDPGRTPTGTPVAGRV